MPRAGRLFISERIWLNSRSRGSGEEAMGFARAACSQGSMMGNENTGKNRDLKGINSRGDDEKATDRPGMHDNLRYKDKSS
jgi:hypothetical protein